MRAFIFGFVVARNEWNVEEDEEASVGKDRVTDTRLLAIGLILLVAKTVKGRYWRMNNEKKNDGKKSKSEWKQNHQVK